MTSQTDKALTDAAVTAALAAPYPYLPNVNHQIEATQKIALGLICWARRQDQPLEALADGDALKAAAAVVKLEAALGVLPDALRSWHSLVCHHISKQLLTHEQQHTSYRCNACDLTGYKLWRQYNTFVNHIQLKCASCAAKEEDRKLDPADGDQIGSLIPAVPTVEQDTYWGYTLIPPEGYLWWKALRT